MRERTKLDDGITAVQTLESDLSDAIEIMEMAEAEGDDDMYQEAEDSLKDMAELAKKSRLFIFFYFRNLNN